MYLQNQRLQMTRLVKCLKSLVPEKPWTNDTLMGLKNCSNLHDNTFIILLYHSESN